ncbi:DNA binding domain with preference for A/T rich regions-like protein, partial [Metarhizium brunneum ARSEF 3297]
MSPVAAANNLSTDGTSAHRGHEAQPVDIVVGANGGSSIILPSDTLTAAEPLNDGQAYYMFLPAQCAATHTNALPTDIPYTSGSYAYYDGRVKNGVPAKLQNVDHGKNGNFAVMHMGVTNLASAERLAAARRTSEGTAAASRLFNQAGYKSLRQLKQNGPAVESQQQELVPNTARKERTRGKPQPGHGFAQRTTSLSSHETKTEQARLLTLLRSLNPVMVVDQLCRGLAYFGGIPGAPPPADDSAFPQSNAANGSGHYFVGWLAEIFPNVDASTAPHPSVPDTSPPGNHPATTASPWMSASSPASKSATTVSVAPTVQTDSSPTKEDAIVPGKRKRGRPKGSKSSKVRADKGKRHMSKALKYSVPLVIPAVAENESVAEGDNMEADVPVTSDDAATPVLPDDPNTQSNAPKSTPVAKKRGRPKGSKNRPKTNINDENQTAPRTHDATPAQTQTTATPPSGTANAENIISNNDYSAQSQFAGDNLGRHHAESSPNQPNMSTQQPIAASTSSSSPRKRYVTQQSQLDVLGSNNQVAPSSQAPQGTKRQRVSNGSVPNIGSGSQPGFLSGNFDSQTQSNGSGVEGMGLGPHATQTSRLGQFYIATSPQQQQLESPNLSHAIPRQQTNHPFASQRINAAAQNYHYNQHGLQQTSHHMTPISPSGRSFGPTIANNADVRLSQDQAKQQPAGPQAGGRKQGYFSNHNRPPGTQSSANTALGAYSTFNTQGFM